MPLEGKMPFLKLPALMRGKQFRLQFDNYKVKSKIKTPFLLKWYNWNPLYVAQAFSK